MELFLRKMVQEGMAEVRYMQHFSREKDAPSAPGTFAEWRKLNWTAIVAGVVAMLGLEAFLLAFGGAVGLSTFNFYDIAGGDGPYKVPVATILWLAIAVLSSSFFGAWIAGHWANLEEGEDAVMHGALTWALGAVLAGAGVFSMMETGAGAAAANPMMTQAASTQRNSAQKGEAPGPLSFSALDDPNFANFLGNRADAWAQTSGQVPARYDRDNKSDTSATPRHNTDVPPTTAPVAPDSDRNKVKPDDVAKDVEYKSFIMSQTGISDDQADKFLKENKDVIAQAQANSQRNWEQANARELAHAEKFRKASSVFAWSMTVIGLLALGAAVGGSYLGWTARYHPELTVIERPSGRVIDSTTGEPM